MIFKATSSRRHVQPLKPGVGQISPASYVRLNESHEHEYNAHQEQSDGVHSIVHPEHKANALHRLRFHSLP